MLWNACQSSLYRHGELHVNLRMSWGKQLLMWHTNPKQALKITIDLNNRYALDGRDPSSYGGILWCFGLFDRPFKSEKKVWGTVRSRTTENHQNRLDLQQYKNHIDREQYQPITIRFNGPSLIGVLLHRYLIPYSIKAISRHYKKSSLSYSYDHRSTRSKLEVLSWRDSGWIEIKDNTITWTAKGKQEPKYFSARNEL